MKMRVLTYAGVSTLALLIAGCGGGGGAAASTNPKVTIKWPSTTRTFQANPDCRSARITLTSIDSPSLSQTWVVTRPEGTAEVTQVHTAPERQVNGDCQLAVEFMTAPDGTGPIFASLGTNVEVQGDGTLANQDGSPITYVFVAVENFHSIAIDNATVQVNSEQPLMASALLLGGNSEIRGAIPTGSVEFQIEGDAATIANGKLRGVKQGNIILKAKYKLRDDRQAQSDFKYVHVIPAIDSSQAAPRLVALHPSVERFLSGPINISGERTIYVKRSPAPMMPDELVRMDVVTGQTSKVIEQSINSVGFCKDGVHAWVGRNTYNESPQRQLVEFKKVNLQTGQVTRTTEVQGGSHNAIVVNPFNDDDFLANVYQSVHTMVRYRDGQFATYEQGFNLNSASFISSTEVWATVQKLTPGRPEMFTKLLKCTLSPSDSSFTVNEQPLNSFGSGDYQSVGSRVFSPSRNEFGHTLGILELASSQVSYHKDPIATQLESSRFISGEGTFGANCAPEHGVVFTHYIVSSPNQPTFIVLRTLNANDMSERGTRTVRVNSDETVLSVSRHGAKGLVVVTSKHFMIFDTAPGL